MKECAVLVLLAAMIAGCTAFTISRYELVVGVHCPRIPFLLIIRHHATSWKNSRTNYVVLVAFAAACRTIVYTDEG